MREPLGRHTPRRSQALRRAEQRVDGAARTPSPMYLEAGAEHVFALFHPADGSQRQTTSVLICPPLGWEDISSYRSRRAWAQELAGSGFPAMRIDLPATGDSGGRPRDPQRLLAWTSAVTTAARQLRAMPGCERVAAIGIGLGGLLLCEAIAEDAPIEEVALWAVGARGRTQLRELRAFSRLQDFKPAGLTSDEAASPSDGELTAGGFLLSGETVADVEQLDVAAMTLAPHRLRRALLLGRDGVPADARLQASLEQQGVLVASAPGDGYSAMMAKPQFARSPTTTFALVESWLQETSSAAASVRAARSSTSSEPAAMVELSVAGTRIRERPLAFSGSQGKLFGILSESLSKRSELCVVMLNAGAIRHIGPNRMWVEAARRWAALGVPTVRLDLEGIGDADGDEERFAEESEFHVPQLVAQVRSALDVLQDSGIARRFVLTGLCSGAYWSFHAALEDERVSAAFMLNPRAIYWDPSLDASRDLRRGLLRPSSWRKVLRGEVSLARIAALAVKLPFTLPLRAFKRWQERHGGGDAVERAFDLAAKDQKRLALIFSENEPLHEEFEQEGRLGCLEQRANVTIELIPGRDHTLRPLESQRCAHEALDRALERELALVGEPQEQGAPPAIVVEPRRKREREQRLVA